MLSACFVMDLTFALPLAALAVALEAIAGYPRAVFQVAGHPVTWIGLLIARLDRHLNKEHESFTARRVCGVAAVVIIIAAAVVPALLLQDGLRNLPAPLALVAVAIPASSLIAQRSLHEHVLAVAEALESEGLSAGRRAVAMIVGRNPETLDEAGVCRAAIESLAENFSDGIVAPVFWLAVAGLPGAAAYKAVNTADSMIGHRTPRHAAFGWAAARLDDLVNLPASRLSALLLVAAAALMRGADAKAAVASVCRDAHRHRSPNAGWPEAAMAGALGLRLAGPRVYGTTRVDDAFMGNGRAEATAADIRRALALFRRAALLQWLVLVALAALVLA